MCRTLIGQMRSLPIDSLFSIVFIFQGLFLGSIGAANNEEELKKLNIMHLLTVADSLPPKYPNGNPWLKLMWMWRPQTIIHWRCSALASLIKRRPNQVKRTCYAQSSQIRQVIFNSTLCYVKVRIITLFVGILSKAMCLHLFLNTIGKWFILKQGIH